eukprot:TRINITY_DN5044_c0_g1_i1.p1 TRINITY_DN5044_c0_g1~~TRINITY_DN5044_c0_g1_i1.p1  ORF type:complete len:239 (+),score=53.39 TRINITY_DN5044_c0_g1_i1:30-719(+)
MARGETSLLLLLVVCCCVILTVYGSDEETEEMLRERFRNGIVPPYTALRKSEITCSVCVWLVDQLEGFALQPGPLAEMEEYVDGVCGYLPVTLQTECEALVKNYTKVFVELVIKEAPPQNACAEIKLCNNSAVPLLENSTECQVCQYVLSDVASLFASNSSVQGLLEAASAACKEVPKKQEQTCLYFIKQYGPALLRLIIQRAGPSTACSAMGLCTSPLQPYSLGSKLN